MAGFLGHMNMVLIGFVSRSDGQRQAAHWLSERADGQCEGAAGV